MIEVTGVGRAAAAMPGIRIERLASGGPSADLHGWFLDAPESGALPESAALDIRGWVVGATARPVAVEVVHGSDVISRAPVRLPRPDVEAVYPGAPAARQSGFATTVRMVPHSSFQLTVRAVLSDHRRVPLARICYSGHGGDADGPLVSVIITCFKHAHYLPEAIESVLRQTYPRVDIVVVDDGSPDNSLEVARRYPGIHVVEQAHAGVSVARNAGLRACTGEYVLFLDADDRLLPHCVETGLRVLAQHPTAAFVSGLFRYVRFDGVATLTRRGHVVDTHHYEAMLRFNYIPMCATVFFRRKLFSVIGGWDPRLRSAEDYDVYLRATRLFPVVCHDVEVAEYRRHGFNTSNDAVLMLCGTLTALGRHKRHTRRDAQLREAYQAGERFWVHLWRQDAVRQIRVLAEGGNWLGALKALLRLLRFDPEGARSVFSVRTPAAIL